MKIELSDHFDYSKLLRYALPSVIMLVVTSIYSVVDGFFCLQFCRENAFCGNQFYHARADDLGLCRLYDGDGRRRV